MDYGCVTPLYIYRMWCGNVSLEEIGFAMQALRQSCSLTDEELC